MKPPSVPEPVQEGDEEGELLFDGQEEVFSRTEVELGRIEHATEAGEGRPYPLRSG